MGEMADAKGTTDGATPPLISHATEGILEVVSMAQEDGITQGVFSIVVRANCRVEL